MREYKGRWQWHAQDFHRGWSDQILNFPMTDVGRGMTVMEGSGVKQESINKTKLNV